MKNIYILLICSNTILSRIIRDVTKVEFTHASISFSNQIFPCYSFGRKFTYLIYPAGFKLEPFNSGFFKHNKGIPCGLYKIEVTDEQYRKAKEFINSIKNDTKKHGFNTLGLFLCKFGVSFKRKRKMFCSEFVATTLNYCGVSNFKNPELVQPIQLLNIDGIQCLYKGKLKDVLLNIEKFEL